MSFHAKPSAIQAIRSETISSHFSRRRPFGGENAVAPASASERSRKLAKSAVTAKSLLRLFQRVRFRDQALRARRGKGEVHGLREPQPLRHVLGGEGGPGGKELLLEELS